MKSNIGVLYVLLFYIHYKIELLQHTTQHKFIHETLQQITCNVQNNDILFVFNLRE